MSADYKFYHFADGHFLDLNEDDLSKLCPRGCEIARLMQDVRHKLRELQGAWTLKFMREGIRACREGCAPVLFKYSDEPDNQLDDAEPPPPASPPKPRNLKYLFQLKADTSGGYDGKNTIFYKVEPQGRVNNSEPWEPRVIDSFAEPVPLAKFMGYLRDCFSLSSEDLIQQLNKLDLGTTAIDLSLDGANGKYRVDRIYQAQAPSFRKQLISQLSADKESLQASIEKLKGEKLVLEKNLERLLELQKIEKDYKALLDKLGLQHNVDEQVSQIAQTRHRTSLIQPLSAKLTGEVRKRLAPLPSEATKQKELQDRISNIINYFITDEASVEEIENLGKANDSIPEKLQSKLQEAVSDHLLYHFSAAETRSPAKAKRFRSIMNHYGMDFIDFSPGKSVTSKECRFVKALESEHPRGTCVETLASGIINLSSGYVIYKADVVISK